MRFSRSDTSRVIPFLADALVGNSTAVVAAVARVDHNGALAGSKGGQGHETGDGRGRNKSDEQFMLDDDGKI